MELEENIRRKDMEWQEYVLGVLDIHLLRSQESAIAGEEWGQTQTAISIGRSRQRVGQILPVARYIRDNPESEVAKSPDVTSAYTKLMEQLQRQAEGMLAAQSLGNGLALNNMTSTGAPLASSALPPGIGQSLANALSQFLMPEQQESISTEAPQPNILDLSGLVPIVVEPVLTEPELKRIDINLYNFYRNESCLVWMAANPNSVNHIVTDPPYAIDMANLQQENTGMDVEKTVNEHVVKDNIELLKKFVPLAFKTIKDKGFLVMFCDAMNFRWLVDLGTEAGFAVQRWTNVWCKVSGMNQAAGFNFTKATEDIIVMRKPGSTLIEHQPLNWRVVQKTIADKDFDHPFAKPFELWSWIVDAISVPSHVIYEPFVGSGSGVSAFIRKGRRWFASEIGDQHHLEFLRNTAKTLIEQFSGQRYEVHVHYTPPPLTPKLE